MRVWDDGSVRVRERATTFGLIFALQLLACLLAGFALPTQNSLNIPRVFFIITGEASIKARNRVEDAIWKVPTHSLKNSISGGGSGC